MASFRFLDLPLEIRSNVYELLLHPGEARLSQDKDGDLFRYKWCLSIFRVNKQIHEEAIRMFRQLNVFARIETPWSEAETHVAIEGNVPLVATGEAAESFYHSHLRVVIDTPRYTEEDRGNRKFIVLADDLEAFATMWYYSDLSYGAGLNPHLRLSLYLQTLPTADGQQREDVRISNALQEKLLLPFGIIKGISETHVIGERNKSIEKKMRDTMAIPYETAAHCLEEATKLKDAGNKALMEDKNPKEAIRLYIESFMKIHIKCDGRKRAVWGDSWFDIQLHGGIFDGQHGQMVRMILRIRLVANIVKAYLDLEEYDEAYYWGMRTIKIMRGSMGGEDIPTTNFPAAIEIGKIYYRTGLAAKHTGDDSESRKLLRVALEYLPHEDNVQTALASVALKLR